MEIRVRFFAQARALAGVEEARLELPEGATVESLRPHLPEGCRSFGIAVNERWAAEDTPLRNGDEVAVLPPVSGGSASLLTDAPIEVERLIHAVADVACGGTVLFLGTVRNEFQGRPSSAVHYEAYVPMAEQELRQIVEQAKAQFGVRHVALQHRLGTLPLGSVSVAIAVSSPHRAEAFEACRFIIESLKRRVPIWKQEIGPDGAVWQSALVEQSDEATPEPT